jgi:hypothetical protein
MTRISACAPGLDFEIWHCMEGPYFVGGSASGLTT